MGDDLNLFKLQSLIPNIGNLKIGSLNRKREKQKQNQDVPSLNRVPFYSKQEYTFKIREKEGEKMKKIFPKRNLLFRE